MKLLVFSIFDEKAKSYANPFYMATKGQASRSFGDLCQDEQSTISKHPEDYSLYHIATYDDSTGKFNPLEIPELIIRAMDFKTSIKE